MKTSASIEPIIVYGPCWRCGTTLVQRLLNSTGKILIYGEDSYLVALITATAQLTCRIADYQRTLDVFLSGNTEFWSNGLLPEPAAYGAHASEVLSRQLALHQAWSEHCGRSRWGFKYPLTQGEAVEQTLEVVPRARIVFIYRNVYDVARSAIARAFVKDAHGLRALARQWNRNLLGVLSSGLRERPDVLLLEYEALLGNPARHLARLETFCRVKGIRASVLDRKINAPTGYVSPAELSRAEFGILAEEACEAMDLAYPARRPETSSTGAAVASA